MDAISVFRPQRAVSARELTRRMAHVLDEIQDSGFAVTVVRYGRAVAVLAPLEGARVGPAERWRPTQPPLGEEIGDIEIKLTENNREVLRLLSAEPSGEWSLNDGLPGRPINDALVAATQLELAGVVERVGARIRFTKKSRRFAVTLEDQVDDQVSVRSAADREG